MKISCDLHVVHFNCLIADVPNAGKKLVRLDYRKEWDIAFRNYLKNLEEKKPVILCGDLNVAHLDIGNYSSLLTNVLHNFFSVYKIDIAVLL